MLHRSPSNVGARSMWCHFNCSMYFDCKKFGTFASCTRAQSSDLSSESCLMLHRSPRNIGARCGVISTVVYTLIARSLVHSQAALEFKVRI